MTTGEDWREAVGGSGTTLGAAGASAADEGGEGTGIVKAGGRRELG